MKISRRLLLAACSLILPGLAASPAMAAPEVLTLHHFLGPKSATQLKFLEPWARKVEADSKGEIEVKIFPSMSLGGKPPELYGQARDGAADIVWTLIGYTPGVFPRAEVFELPSVHHGSAEATNQAIQALFSDIAADFTEIHPILIHVHGGNALHMASKPVHDVSDLAGVKLRTPSRTGAWMIEAFGAEPVGMPVPELPQALARGTVEGALVPFEVMPPLKLDQLTRYSIEGDDGSRFGTSVFMFAMNKARYESLPEHLKAVIDNNSGVHIAADIGRVWDENEADGKAAQLASGGEIIKLTPEQMQPFRDRSQQVVDRWVEEMNGRGLDGEALVEKARAAIARFSHLN